MSSHGATHVMIADDSEIVRAELSSMFTADAQYEVVGVACDGVDLLGQLATRHCDVVLLDLSMPRKNGLQVLVNLQDRGQMKPVVIISMHDEAVYVDRALSLGAVGYVLKSAPRTEIVRAMEAAVRGGAYLQPEVAKTVLERHLVLHAGRASPQLDLSTRQLEVLRGLAIGLSNKQIADQMGLAKETVKGYLKDLYARLGVTTRASAAAVGIRRGLI